MPEDSQQHCIIAFAPSVLHSLLKSQTVPEIISVSKRSTPPKFCWETAFVRVGGTTSLSPLNYILIRDSSRPNPEGRRSKLRNVTVACQEVDVKSPRNMFESHCGFVRFVPETHVFQASCATGRAVNHVFRAFCGHLINFISCINHDRLTFIVWLMGWSSGLGCDKCCYLSRARINRVCAQNGSGRLETKERGGTGHRTVPQRLLCTKKCWNPRGREKCILSTFLTNLSQNIPWWGQQFQFCCCWRFSAVTLKIRDFSPPLFPALSKRKNVN